MHHGYAVLTGLTAVALYVVAGAAFVCRKSDAEIRRRAARAGRVAVGALGIGTTASWVLAPLAGQLTLHPGATARLPVVLVGAAALLTGLAQAARALATGRAPALATVSIYAGGLLVAGGLLYPTLVPPGITVHDAASPHSSLLFLTIAGSVIVPVILAYQALGYWVFRGKHEAPVT
jgi:cytochrome bd ubiquinol oxidase subunit II